MKVNIKATNMELTAAISAYLMEKLQYLKKLINDPDDQVMMNVELGQVSKHHRQGDIFRAEIRFHLKGKSIYAVADEADLYAAIDEVKDEVVREIKTHFEKKNTLLRRGGRAVKGILRGFYTYPVRGLKGLSRFARRKK